MDHFPTVSAEIEAEAIANNRCLAALPMKSSRQDPAHGADVDGALTDTSPSITSAFAHTRRAGEARGASRLRRGPWGHSRGLGSTPSETPAHRPWWSRRGARRLPNNELVICPDAGHAGIFQFHEEFVEKALEFLAK